MLVDKTKYKKCPQCGSDLYYFALNGRYECLKDSRNHYYSVEEYKNLDHIILDATGKNLAKKREEEK